MPTPPGRPSLAYTNCSQPEQAPGTAAQWLAAALRLLPEGAGLEEQRTALLLQLAFALGAAGHPRQSRDTLHAVLGQLDGNRPDRRAEAVTFCALLERRLSRQNVVAGHAERIHVRPRVRRLSLHLLRAHVQRCPHRHTRLRQVERLIAVAQAPEGTIIDVTDTGPGIPSELQSRIFDRFYRVDKARSLENGGTGLGLAIAKWAVEVNGGRLTLEPTNGAGSRFRITLSQTAIADVTAPCVHSANS